MNYLCCITILTMHRFYTALVCSTYLRADSKALGIVFFSITAPRLQNARSGFIADCKSIGAFKKVLRHICLNLLLIRCYICSENGLLYPALYKCFIIITTTQSNNKLWELDMCTLWRYNHMYLPLGNTGRGGRIGRALQSCAGDRGFEPWSSEAYDLAN